MLLILKCTIVKDILSLLWELIVLGLSLLLVSEYTESFATGLSGEFPLKVSLLYLAGRSFDQGNAVSLAIVLHPI